MFYFSRNGEHFTHFGLFQITKLPSGVMKLISGLLVRSFTCHFREQPITVTERKICDFYIFLLKSWPISAEHYTLKCFLHETNFVGVFLVRFSWTTWVLWHGVVVVQVNKTNQIDKRAFCTCKCLSSWTKLGEKISSLVQFQFWMSSIKAQIYSWARS